MPTIVVAGEKGGSGKTTLSYALATALSMRGLSVALIDADPAGNLTEIHARGDQKIPLTAESNANKIVNVIKQLETEYDYVLVDNAGFGSQTMIYSIFRADLVLIPAIPSGTDMKRAVATVEHVRSVEGASTGERKIQYAIILNGVQPMASITEYARSELSDYVVLNNAIPHSTNFREATLTGQFSMKDNAFQRIDFILDELGKRGLLEILKVAA